MIFFKGNALSRSSPLRERRSLRPIKNLQKRIEFGKDASQDFIQKSVAMLVMKEKGRSFAGPSLYIYTSDATIF